VVAAERTCQQLCTQLAKLITAAGLLAVVAHLLALVAVFIGERITERLIREACGQAKSLPSKR
jgi:hypothetical protein